MGSVHVEASAEKEAQLASQASSSTVAAVINVPSQTPLKAMFVTTSSYIYVANSQWLTNLVTAVQSSAQSVCNLNTDV
jgi:hypothetical protein